MAHTVSIKDIAKAAGVSFSTVSRALNDNPSISQEVRTRIHLLAESMGYTPNALAQGLLSRRSQSVGLVITTISDPFFVDLVKGVEEIAQAAGISIFLATSNNDPDREIRIIEMFSRRRVDGVIVAASRISRDYASRLEKIDIPVIMINNQAEGEYQNLYSISLDDRAGGKLAAQHLLDLGHRSIGYIGISNRPGSNVRRLDGYQGALLEAGISPTEEWICVGETSANGDLSSDVRIGKTLAKNLLASGITAVFCYCDTVAAGVLAACRELGISVPGQLSVVGFDDNELCEIVTPPLTTIGQPKLDMGQQAMQMLLANIQGAAIEDSVVAPYLVVRESTAPPARTL